MILLKNNIAVFKKKVEVCAKSQGFTLAEVLITLGVIGIVAAMTIPALISNMNATKFKTQYKKTVAALANAGRMGGELYGFDYGGLSQVCSSSNAGSEDPRTTSSVCALFNGTLSGATYMKAGNIKIPGTNKNYTITSNFVSTIGASMINLNSVHAYILPDGAIVAISPNMGKFGCTLTPGTQLKDQYSDAELTSCIGFIDVNGATLPNKEVSCSSGQNTLSKNTCIVKNNSIDMSDIYPIRFHDGNVEPATAAARYVLNLK